MKIRQFSLRYKVLILLTTIPLVMLVAFLSLALKIFREDKVAYVFESNSLLARTLSSQLSSELNSVLMSVKPIFQEYLLENHFNKISKSYFESEGSVTWMAVFKPNAKIGGTFDQLAFIERKPGEGAADLAKLNQMDVWLSESYYQGRVMKVPFSNQQALLLERVGEVNQPDLLFFAVMVNLPSVMDLFEEPSHSQSYLVDLQGRVLSGPIDHQSQMISEKIGEESFKSISQRRQPAGVENVKWSNENLLVAFSKATYGDLMVYSLVPESTALSAVRVLILRSILFLFFLLGITMVISLFASKSVTSALTNLSEATKKVSDGDFTVRVNVHTQDEIGSLANSFNSMAQEVSLLMEETAQKARMENELKTAQTVQGTLFPQPRNEVLGMKINGFYKPASECGGDWWNYCQVGDELVLWIGDATGHGVPAALLTSAAKSASSIIEKLGYTDPDRILELLNRSIYEVSRGQLMMTFLVASYNPQSGVLRYANASHEAPYLMKKSEAPLAKKDLVPLNDVSGARLGQNLNSKYEIASLSLQKGDRILFYTDGVADIQNPEQQALGERNFIKNIVQCNKTFPDVDVAMNDLTEYLLDYRKDSELIDDVTFFMTEVI